MTSKSMKRIIALHERLDEHMKEIVSGAAVALSLKVVAAGTAFALHVVLARLLGAEGTGIYFLAFTVIAIGAVIGRLGLDNAMLRYIAAHASVQDWSAVKGVSRKGLL